MKYPWIFILAASLCLFVPNGALAQNGGNVGGNVVFSQSIGPVSAAGGVPVSGVMIGAADALGAPVYNAPYSATITNQSVQTLADGNRIVQTSTGTVARDSQGRTRRDLALPAIGGLSAANAPHLVFIQDPVSQTSYTLNLTGKTAQKMPAFGVATSFTSVAGGPAVATSSALPGGAYMATGSGTPDGPATTAVVGAGVPPGGPFFIQMGNLAAVGGPMPPLPPPYASSMIAAQRVFTAGGQSQVSTEDLGIQTMEGVSASGMRVTRTIPAGQIGNDRPIEIVTEVWTSPDLQTIVSSKRSDPRMGEQTFQLTNISRTEPAPSLFTVPSDFKIIDVPQPILYRPAQ